ncbi:metal ABC transporter solute-binding protein, Zn/Mn family, partial [Enterococcus gallinarum]
KEQLVKLYPKKAKTFETNAEKYLTKLTALDKEFQTALKDAKQKSFVTQHAAFGYLALDYGLKQVPIAGLTPEQEPTAGRLAELKKYVTDNQIRYIYFEKNANDKIAKTLADEANVQLEVLNPLESLTQKQMDNGEDYLSVM